MLAFRQSLSLVSLKNLGGWSPTQESSLVAWYQNKEGITLNGTDVSDWRDSSANSHDMVQATESRQPAYDSGILTFVAADSQFLQTTSQISLDTEFTIGMRIRPAAFSNVILGDNTSANEFFKFTASTNLRIKIDGFTINLDLDSGTFGDDYLVITRDSANLITLYQNGTAQETTATLGGACDVDAIGVRATNLNTYEGDVKEIQIYDSASSALTANVNNRLSNI
jgi:hypothetical protein